jgi:HD-like signal output (HDOD) protein
MDMVDDALGEMKALNYTLPRVMAVMNNINSSARDLVRVIQMDPVLTARVLRVSNSAYFGMREEVTSLHRATILLGMNTIRNLALATAVRGNFRLDSGKCLIRSEDFWRYTVGTAVMSELIARTCSASRPQYEEAFVVGLLHSIGKALFIQVFPEKYNEVVGGALERQVVTDDVEVEVFGVNHREVGLRMAQKWHLPESVCDGILHYSCPSDSTRSSTWIVGVSSSQVKDLQVGFSGDLTVHPIGDETYTALKLEPSSLKNVVRKDFEEALLRADAFIKGG